MKIVVFTHAAGSPKHGPNLRWYFLGRRLKELGCEVTVVGSSYFHKYVTPPKVSGFSSEYDIDGIRYIFLRNIKYSGFWGRIVNQFLFLIASRFWCFLHAKKHNPDIVVSSSPPPFCVFSAKKMAEKIGAQLVYEVRDLWPMVVQELSGASSNHPYIKLLKYTEDFAITHSDLVVSVKKGDFEYFRKEYGLPDKNFSCLPNGFLPDESIGSANEPLNHEDGSSLIVGYVGAMSAYYGLRELLEAAQQLRHDSSIRFVLVGGGEDFDSLVAFKEEHYLDNVTFVGRVPKNEVSNYISQFDICYVGLKDVKANLHGISCNKIFEYMYASKPIIASYRTWFDPVKEAECGVTVNPGSACGIRDAILELRGAPEKRQIMGQNARNYFDGNHNFNVIGERYLQKMKEITGR